MRPTIIFAALICVACTGTIRSEDALSPELARLKTTYQSAVTKAVAPLTATYRKELERLLDGFTRAGKLDQALQVKRELTTLDGIALGQSEKESPPKEAVPATTPVTNIEGTTWVAKTGFLERLEFRENGRMTVTTRTKTVYTGWSYKQAQDGSLAITASSNPRPGTFRFTNQGATFEGVFETYKESFKLDTSKK